MGNIMDDGKPKVHNIESSVVFMLLLLLMADTHRTFSALGHRPVSIESFMCHKFAQVR